MTPESIARTLEHEAALLGRLLQDAEAWTDAGHRLRGPDFLGERHRLVYEAIEAAADGSKAVDIFSVEAELRRRGYAQVMGGVEYLEGLLTQGKRSDEASALVEQVLRQSLMRELVKACEEITTTALTAQDVPATKILDEAEMRMFRLADRVSPEVHSVGALATGLLDLIQRRGEVRGLSTGMASLDEAWGPMLPGSFLVLNARPLAGQLDRALGVAQHVALNEKKAVAVFSGYYTAEVLTERLVRIAAGIDQRRLRQGALTGEEVNRLTEAVERLRDANLYVVVSPALTLLEVRATARRLALASGGLGLVVVDDLGVGSGDEPAEAVRALRTLAKELGCVVLLLSEQIDYSA